MKNILKTGVALLAFFASTTAFAQIFGGDTREQKKFGIRAGVNYATIYDNNGNFVADDKLGFVGGAFASIPFGKYIGVQPEVLYSQKGFKASGNVLGFNYNYEETLSYLDVPVQLQIKPISEVTILVGPQYSYLLDTKYEFNDNTSTLQQDAISKDDYKKHILGFVVGADLNLNGFIVGVRSGWDITQTDKDGNSTSSRFKNQVLQATLGYSF
ncbi:MAG TPA: porin family protein [Flavobacterium sp.]|jgi:hypothetical protein